MSSEINKNKTYGTAAWRIAAWATFAFAISMAAVCIYLYILVLNSSQERDDRWLTGEIEVLSEVAQKTPKGDLYHRIVGEVAELATTEVPHDPGDTKDLNNSVFFAQLSSSGDLELWVGPVNRTPFLTALHDTQLEPGQPRTLRVKSRYHHFRTVRQVLPNGGSVFLGFSEHTIHRFLSALQLRFLVLWCSIVICGFAVIFFITRRMLMRVQQITETAASIDQSNLSRRVPVRQRNDEITRLAVTFNRMLDRIESAVGQLHTITGALAHDIKSPLTSLRGKLELALLQNEYGNWSEQAGSALEEVDRLTEFLNRYLDVSEAKANALSLHLEPVEFRSLVETMMELFFPSINEKGMIVELKGARELWMNADRTMMQRMLTNLFDNEIKHPPPQTSIDLILVREQDEMRFEICDNGPGFPEEIRERLFQRFSKGPDSQGHGLGLAFVAAVVRAHGGEIHAKHSSGRGVHIVIHLPLIPSSNPNGYSYAEKSSPCAL
jgi:signal transduction histidine kinase